MIFNILKKKIIKHNIDYSKWIFNKNLYSSNILEDKKIRNTINKFLKKNKLISIYEIANIKIEKKINLINIKIYLGINILLLINLLNNFNNLFKSLKKEISIKLNYYNFNIIIFKIKYIYLYPNILGRFIIKQLKKKVSFNKVFQKTLCLTENFLNIKKIKINISGKIYSKKITYNEYINESFNKIFKNINFYIFRIKTIYGIFSIKINIFL